MKMIAVLALVLTSSAAFAMPVLDCRNAATGAELHIGVYGNQPPFYTLNEILVQNLEQQARVAIPAQGSGGTLRFGRDLFFGVNTSTGYMSVVPEGSGFRVRYNVYRDSDTHNFFFNEGECRNSI